MNIYVYINLKVNGRYIVSWATNNMQPQPTKLFQPLDLALKQFILLPNIVSPPYITTTMRLIN